MEENTVNTEEVKTEVESTETLAEAKTVTEAPQANKSNKKNKKVVEVKAKDVNKKKKKDKQPSKIKKALKDTGNELKKVTWPKFKEVVKQTGVVLAVVVVVSLVLFGFDRLCALLYGLLLK